MRAGRVIMATRRATHSSHKRPSCSGFWQRVHQEARQASHWKAATALLYTCTEGWGGEGRGGVGEHAVTLAKQQ
jgi:hypothetical protein